MGKEKKYYDGPKISKKIGVLIKTGREIKGLSQEKLAWEAGVSRRLIQNLEAKMIEDPKFSTIVKIAKVLGIQPEVFVLKLLE